MPLGVLLAAVSTIALLGTIYGVPHKAGAISPHQAASLAVTGLHVQGNQIVNGAGQPVILHGVDRSGTEYSCTGGGFEDGPTDLASVQAILSWHTNAIRLPLNEDCWLGINGVNLGGAAYQQDLVNFVNLLTQNGLAVILDLHFSAPGSIKATSQEPMADMDHSPAFWTGVANTFKNNSAVIFDLYNEPFPDNSSNGTTAWQCLLNGCTVTAGQGQSYQGAGMQTLVNAVRSTGATNLIMTAGVNYASYLDQWLTYEPNDPAHNIAASWHAYNYAACSNLACWNSTIAPVAQKVPIIVGEGGDTNCTADYTNELLPWLDQEGISYLFWTWDTWNSCEALISNYNGTPTQPYGAAYQAHLASISGNPNPTPASSPTVDPPQPTASPTLPPSSSTSTPTTAPPTASATPPAEGSLPALFDNTGVGNDGTPDTANFDGGGYSYSTQALQAAGLTTGQTITFDGATFQWPSAAPGSADDVVAQGQTITLAAPAAGTTLAFLGAADNGPSAGTGTITYGDGSTQSFQLGLSDWTLNAGKSQPAYGNNIVANSAYRNNAQGGAQTVATDVFYTAVPLQAGKAVVSVTLPATVNQGRLHVFALGVVGPASQPTATSTSVPTSTSTSTPTSQPTATSTSVPTSQPTATNTSVPPAPTASPTARPYAGLLDNIGISDDSAPGAADFDGVGYSYSAQALQAAGLTAGRLIRVNGIVFRWPRLAPGTLDDIVAQGQTITLAKPAAGSVLAFLGAADNGPSAGTGSVTYGDGSTQSFQLGFSDWTLNGGTAQPSYGNSIVASSAYRNSAQGVPQTLLTDVFYTAVPLQAGKTVASVTLPATVNKGRLHVFAIRVATPLLLAQRHDTSANIILALLGHPRHPHR